MLHTLSEVSSPYSFRTAVYKSRSQMDNNNLFSNIMIGFTMFGQFRQEDNIIASTTLASSRAILRILTAVQVPLNHHTSHSPTNSPTTCAKKNWFDIFYTRWRTHIPYFTQTITTLQQHNDWSYNLSRSCHPHHACVIPCYSPCTVSSAHPSFSIRYSN